MAINWKRNKKNNDKAGGENKKGRVLLILVAIFLAASIGILAANQIAVRMTYASASLTDMITGDYRKDDRYVDVCVSAFHTLVEDACLQTGCYVVNGDDPSTVQSEASKIRSCGGLYSFAGENYKYELKLSVKDMQSGETLSVDPSETELVVYDSSEQFTGGGCRERLISPDSEEGYTYSICSLLQTGANVDATSSLQLLRPSGEYWISRNETDEWLRSGETSQYILVNGDTTTVQLEKVSTEIVKLDQFSRREESSISHDYYYSVSDATGRTTAAVDVQVNNSGDKQTLDGNMDWKTVLNLIYALAPEESPEMVPLFYETSNLQFARSKNGNSVFLERYQEKYGNEMLRVPEEYRRNLNIKRYAIGADLVESDTKDCLMSVHTYLMSRNMFVGLFADCQKQWENTASPLYPFERVALLVRWGAVASGALFLLALGMFVAAVCAYREAENGTVQKASALLWLPLELRFVLLGALVLLCVAVAYLYQRGQWLGSFLLALPVVPLYLFCSMLVQCVKDHRRFFANSLTARCARWHVRRVDRRQSREPIYGMGYWLRERTASFIYGESGCLGVILLALLLCVAAHRGSQAAMKAVLLGCGLGLIAAAVLGMMIILYFYMRFIREYAKGLEKVSAQLERMGQGDFEERFAPDATLSGAGLERQFQGIRDSVLLAAEQQMKSERMKIELIANVSHDIKTPLTSIINYVDLLAEAQELPQVERDYVKIIQRKSYRLRDMIQDLFDLSKVNSGNLVVECREIDFTKLIEQTLADMQGQIADAPLQFKCRLEQGVRIQADGNRMYRVLQNLVTNVLKYSMDNTRVYLNLAVQDTQAVFTIKNTSRTELNFTKEEVMERFFRGDKSRSTEGSGLGLAIASSFTQACGGTFDIAIDADLFCAVIRFSISSEVR